MIRGSVCNIVERLARDRDYMWLTKLEFLGRFQTEREALRRPPELQSVESHTILSQPEFRR